MSQVAKRIETSRRWSYGSHKPEVEYFRLVAFSYWRGDFTVTFSRICMEIYATSRRNKAHEREAVGRDIDSRATLTAI